MTTSTSYADAAGWQCDNTLGRWSVAYFASVQPAMEPDPRVSILNIQLEKELSQDLEAIPPEANNHADGVSE